MKFNKEKFYENYKEYIQDDGFIYVWNGNEVSYVVPIENYLNNDSSLYDFDNLELLCIKCHNAERKKDTGVCADGYRLVEGRMVKVNDK